MEIKNHHFYFNDTGSLEIDKYPKKCPMCHISISIEPYLATVNVVNENNMYDIQFEDYQVQAIFRCPSCYRLFISSYARKYQSGDKFYLASNLPYLPKKIDFKKEIRNLSPNFVEIYQQAHIAEKSKLDQIAGCGYRKSLEFLIKDYCIKYLEKDKNTITKKPLGLCIKDDLGCQNTIDCAERAAWLGNDESHYTRTWENHDINSLKQLIELTQHWISLNILTKSYKQEMKNNSKS